MSTGLTKDVSPAERRGMADREFDKNSKDPLAWLRWRREYAASDRDEAFESGDNVLANRHYDTTQQFASAVKELEDLRKLKEEMTFVLRNRIVIAIAEAKEPSWRPTHRHYKGTLYRVTGTKRRSAENDEPVDGVEYDDEEGNEWWLPLHRWISTTGAGKPRYAALLPDDEVFALYV